MQIERNLNLGLKKKKEKKEVKRNLKKGRKKKCNKRKGNQSDFPLSSRTHSFPRSASNYCSPSPGEDRMISFTVIKFSFLLQLHAISLESVDKMSVSNHFTAFSAFAFFPLKLYKTMEVLMNFTLLRD